MGQKVNPNGLRLGINKDWEAKWYSNKKDFAKYLDKDVKIREYLEENLKNAGIAKVEIERNAKKTEVVIHTSKPGVMIGHGGEEIEKLKKELSKIVDENVQTSIVDIKKADLNAQIVADSLELRQLVDQFKLEPDKASDSEKEEEEKQEEKA